MAQVSGISSTERLAAALFVCLIGLSSPRPSLSIDHKDSEMKFKVIIVGAGVSGIGAANKLMRNGITNITILEAMDRIGGRVHYKTLEPKLGGVDLGGHWVHGQRGNIVYELAEPLGLVHHSGDYQTQIIFRPDASQLNINASLYNLLFTSVFGAVKQAAKDPHNADNLADIVDKQVEELLGDYDVTADEVESLKTMVHRKLCILEACDDLTDVSVRQSDDFQESEGDRLIEWKTGGMSNIIHLLTGEHERSPWKGLGVESKVRLSTRVRQIDWSAPDGVQVTTDGGLTLTADYLIFTPSLNVLKNKHKQIFSPPLPKDKVDAIQGLGMDVVDKVYLVYSKPWWPHNSVDYNFLYPKSSSENQGIGESIAGVGTENHNPNVLGVWFIGSAAKKMEALPEEQVRDEILKALHQYMGPSFDITPPDMIIRSQWWNNEDVGGSYSYTSVRSDHLVSPRDTLAAPLNNKHGKPVLLFAGEATNKIHYSTVHGALETGWREADRIISQSS